MQGCFLSWLRTFFWLGWFLVWYLWANLETHGRFNIHQDLIPTLGFKSNELNTIRKKKGSIDGKNSLSFKLSWSLSPYSRIKPNFKYLLFAVSHRRACKNVQRLHANRYSRLNGCGLFIVDASLPLRLSSLITTYVIVILQFHFP